MNKNHGRQGRFVSAAEAGLRDGIDASVSAGNFADAFNQREQLEALHAEKHGERDLRRFMGKNNELVITRITNPSLGSDTPKATNSASPRPQLGQTLPPRLTPRPTIAKDAPLPPRLPQQVAGAGSGDKVDEDCHLVSLPRKEPKQEMIADMPEHLKASATIPPPPPSKPVGGPPPRIRRANPWR